MKKRSLFAAVAMLIVSAIVLTSATYAWFAQGSTVGVAAMKASISNNDGSLLASVTASGPLKQNLTLADFQAVYTKFGDSNLLAPVSMKPTMSGPAFYSCEYTGVTFNGLAAPTANEVAEGGTGSYMDYTWYLKAGSAGTITLTPQFTAGGAFIYGMIIVNGNTYIYGSEAGREYRPLVGSSFTTVTEGATSQNGIIDENDTNGNLALAAENVQVNAPTGDITITLTDTAYQSRIPVRCLVWAEGQDGACTGNATATDCGFGFEASFEAA